MDFDGTDRIFIKKKNLDKPRDRGDRGMLPPSLFTPSLIEHNSIVIYVINDEILWKILFNFKKCE